MAIGSSRRPRLVRWLPLLIGFALFSLTGRAHADVDKVERTKDGDYMIFLDDLLNSDVTQPGGGKIEVRKLPHRVMLIRPRTSYVMEMYKSVENI